ncbi:MAG: metallophosphoesterase [bacterium]
MIVIGDLHGDYYKLKRILENYGVVKVEEKDDDFSLEILDEKSFLVFVGDYVDWREENLENPLNLDYIELVKGTKKIIKLISLLLKNRKNVFALVGNHEDMMFKAIDFIKNFSSQDLEVILEKIEINPYLIVKDMVERNLLEGFISFYNWYSQGGMNTIKSFGSINNLIKSVEEDEIFKNLVVFVNFENEEGRRIFVSHSFPDKFECIDRMVNNSINRDDLNYILWSRKIWGIDAFNSRKTEPFEEEEVISLFDKYSIEKFIIGHTRVSHNTKPLELFGGRIINVDNHGIHFSEPFVYKGLEIKNYISKSYQDFLQKTS